MSTHFIQVVAGPLTTTSTPQRFGVDKGNVGINSDASNGYALGYNQNGSIVYLTDNGGFISGIQAVAIINLAGAAWHTGNGTANVLSFTNPNAGAIIVEAVTIYESHASTGAATVAVGTTTSNNHTASDNLIDDYNLQTSAPNAYSTYSKTDTEVPSQQLASGGWVTFTASADPTGFAGFAYIKYFAI